MSLPLCSVKILDPCCLPSLNVRVGCSCCCCCCSLFLAARTDNDPVDTPSPTAPVVVTTRSLVCWAPMVWVGHHSLRPHASRSPPLTNHAFYITNTTMTSLPWYLKIEIGHLKLTQSGKQTYFND